MQKDTFYALSAEEQCGRLGRLAKQALHAWGVNNCEPRLIKHRENAVFAVQTRTGDPAVLRVHRQDYHSDESLAAELDWMSTLANGGIVVPRPLPTLSGEIVTKAGSDEVTGSWQLDMLSWLDGDQLGDIGVPLNLGTRDVGHVFFELGRTIATMHNISEAWPQQMQVTRHAWDTNGLIGDAPLWGRFWELGALTQAQRDCLLEAKTAIAEDLSAYGQSPSNYGLIHADLVPENIFLSTSGIQLIDFDDSGFGWHMFEIVTTLFWLTAEPQFEEVESQLLAGYRSMRNLTSGDLETMALFFAARSLSYVGWVHTRQSTATAIEMTPIIIELAMNICRRYLADR